MIYSLRDYQSAAIHRATQRFTSGSRRLICVAPTGAGKTLIATEGFIKPALTRNSRILFLAHRIELITQCRDKLNLPDQTGIIKAGHAPNPAAPVQIASVQTLVRRKLPSADLVIIDECHHATAESYRRILDNYPFAMHIGLTATPYRQDGKGLGRIADAIIEVASISQLIALGYLVPPRTFALPPPDLTGIRTVAGDYNEEQLAERMNKPRIGCRIVETYQKHATGRSAICFAVNVQHSRDLCAAFKAAGIAAEHVDGTTPADERAAILDRLHTGQTLIVCNCAVLTEGFDEPRVKCIILVRPTKSRCLWRQCVGRGLRPYPGYADCQIHDHAGCHDRHGHVEADEELSLEDGVKPKQNPPAHRQCPQCYAILPGSPERCEMCGFVFPVVPVKPPETVNVDLVEIARPNQPLDLGSIVVTAEDALTYSHPSKYYLHLLGLAVQNNYKPGWVSHRFIYRFPNLSRPYHMVERDLNQRKRLASLQAHL